jgi:N utilization substance protein A
MVVSELRGEKIDVVEWSEDPAKFVANALSPAKVKEVKVNEDEHTAEVIVPDNQLSLAIGKEGQNARLAAKLTGWRIDIKSESQAKGESAGHTVFEAASDDGELAADTTAASNEPAEMAEDDGLCCAVKSSGEHCTNKARPNSAYCGVHKKLEES